MNLLTLALYAAAGVAYGIHFARRSPSVGRAATTLLLLGALTHTFAIGMQTMEVRHVPFANPSRAVSDRSICTDAGRPTVATRQRQRSGSVRGGRKRRRR